MTKPSPVIAVVDDEESVCRALTRLLRSAGMEATTFSSGAQFIESLKTHRPHCVVLDLHMPEMSGFDVQARLLESGVRVPVIIMTGHDSPETRDRALSMGPAAYLRKPVDGEVLLDAIAVALARDPG
jgi:FixJ family two-component response regulator